MEILKEISNDYANGQTYLLDGTKLLGYAKASNGEVYYFKNPLPFSKRYRKFVPGNKALFSEYFQSERQVRGRQVKGSKGTVYTVDDERGTCTCAGFQFRGTCKHLESK